MSRIFEFFSQAIKTCNVFTSPVNLRYKLDPDYNTFAGGVVSIILIILLMSVFYNSWVDLLNKNDITSSTEVIREMDPSYMSANSDDFMFTIGVTGMNLSDTTQNKFFDLKISKSVINNYPNGTWSRSVTELTLEPCTTDHWSQLGSEFVDTFNRQGLSAFLCVPRNTTIEVSGKYTSEKFIYYKLTFQKCVGKPGCRTQAQIDAWVSANISFFFNFYYSNTLLNTDQKEPVSKFFEDKDYMMFSPTLSTSTNLYLGEYEMKTDESLFPWANNQIDTGFIINRAEKQSWNYMSTPTEPYCKFYLRKSNVKLQIERKFRKLDDMLSYIGGLFGIISVAVGFIMNYYGQCSFQLQMCQNIFDYHNQKSNKRSMQQNQQSRASCDMSQYEVNQNKPYGNGWSTNTIKEEIQDVIQPKDFGFFDFFIHILVYVPLKKICNIKWKRMQIYEESLEEMRHKLDISHLLEKLTFYDRSINSLFDENQLKLLYLQEKFNFQEVRQERNMLSLREDIVANLFGMMADEVVEPPEEQPYKKKSLKEIAQRRSRTKVHTFVNSPVNVFDILQRAGMKRNSVSQNEDDVNLPADIKNALKKLDTKIEAGDPVSIRIYNGLQYELLEVFEKSKLNTLKHCVTSKKMKKVRSKSKSRQLLKGFAREDRKYEMSFLEMVDSPPVVSVSIHSLDSNE